MVDDGSAQSAATWPLPKFYFSVDFGFGVPASFQEASGLEIEPQVIAYRRGDSPVFSTARMPGIAKVSNVTLRKGIFANGEAFSAWRNEIAMNMVRRRTVTIDLLDEAGSPSMRWMLSNAWPTKVTGTDLKADGNEISVESIELACETISITPTSQ